MLNHPVVDVALGLVLLYSALSLVASAAKEWISTVFRLRARNLQVGIRMLIGQSYAARLYRHPLIRNLSQPDRLPSYIDANTFSVVLIDLLAENENGGRSVSMGDAATDLTGLITNDYSLATMLEAMTVSKARTVADLQPELAAWFDQGMSRVAGWYRRRAQYIILAVAAVVTVLTNASTVHVVRDIWQDDALRYAVAQETVLIAASAAASPASAAASPDALQIPSAVLDSFPMGWDGEDPFGLDDQVPTWTVMSWFAHLMGWLFTTAAVSLGAPFWFDLLSKVASLRGTGMKPKRWE